MYALRFNRFKCFGMAFIFISFILSFVFYTQSYAVTSRSTLTEDNAAYDFCLNEGYDSLKDAYKYRYRCYNAGGCWEGTFYISSSIHDSTDKSYVLFVNGAGDLRLYQTNTKVDYFNFDIEYAGRWYLCYSGSKGVSFSGKRYHYNNDEESFFVANDYSEVLLAFGPDSYSPDSILLSNADVKYNNRTYLYCRSNDVLTVPDLKQKSDGFRFYLNDFVGFTDINEAFSLERSIEACTYTLYDFNSKSFLLQNVDILSIRDVDIDDEERYYLDVLYSELPTQLQIVDGDYLIAFTTILNNNKIFPDYTYTKKYVDISYFRYRYYADSGVGILIPTDENGEPVEPDTPDNPDTPTQDDKTSEAINNQTNVIKEQTDAINNQTNAINEQTEVNKSIWQTIIDLPRNTYRYVS